MRGSRSNVPALIAGLVVLLAVLAVNWRVLERHPQKAELNRILAPRDTVSTRTDASDAWASIVTFAVGPMRGLIADVLWWRAIQMQDRGDFFEAIQLADWISKLQPAMAMVWAWHGWNMSANIVNEVREPDERWKWVHQGIVLLRDQGLSYNPGNAIIRRELANIFHFRIGGTADPYNEYYKRQWVTIMERYLRAGDAAELEAIREAPASEEELFARAGVGALVEVAKAVGVDLLAWREVGGRAEWSRAQRDAILAPGHADAWTAVLHYHVRRRLAEDLRLDIGRMLLIDEHYGPLDWRLWQAQTIYWAAEDGLPGSGDKAYGSGAMENTFIQQAMVSSFKDGRLVYMSDKLLMTSNNLEIIGNIDHFMHVLVEDNPNPSKGAIALFRDFHEAGAVILYNYGYLEEAEAMYHAFRDEFMTPEEQARSTFESFLAARTRQMLREQATDDTYSLVLSSYYQAYTWLALGDSHKAAGFENFARLLWARHQQRFRDVPNRALPPVQEIRRTALDLATGPASTLPEELQDILRRQRGEAEDLAIEATGPRGELALPHHEHDDEHDE